MIPITTPIGLRCQKPIIPSPLGKRSSGTVSPCRRATSSAETSNVTSARATSTLQSRSGLPVSSTKSCSNSSRLATNSPCVSRNHSRLTRDERRDISPRIASAESIAAVASAASPTGASATCSPLNGNRTGSSRTTTQSLPMGRPRGHD